ncbi:uncharacterized protein BEWA_023800 [Theileria equi strain WA]|uniref:Membrane protein, putative n=1 Tax=Theileria equi strain WA TaxID=1537102 RepID=L0AWY2_THEEQ|nr:uncharacterized protein BEWA_023800 [Theileria equi strain WA]AFZ79531.1 membrane protein, putative [Theileria equi strain WA]|eukprot:XP_004829197.1 uncharacterized protein BEWA_023800 [Theileria equi strain WA]
MDLLAACFLILSPLLSDGAKTFKRSGFLAPVPVLHSCSKNLALGNHIKGNLQLNHSERKANGRLNALKSQNRDINKEESHSFDQFTGLDDVFDKKLLFSGRTLELSKEDFIARQTDYENYKNDTLHKMKQFITIVTSAIAVGVLYQVLSLFKRFLEQQHLQLKNESYEQPTHTE